MRVALMFPTYLRAHRIMPLYENIEATTPEPHCSYFIVENDDSDSIEVCEDAMMENLPNFDFRIVDGHTPTKAQNDGFSLTREPLCYFSGDDCEFTKGWLSPLLHVLEEDLKICVVASNDGLVPEGKSGYLYKRSYIMERGVIDEPGKVFHEGYGHVWCDTEFYHTAVHRGVFAYCAQSIVHHRNWATTGRKKDATAIHLDALNAKHNDGQVYADRVHLFGGGGRR